MDYISLDFKSIKKTTVNTRHVNRICVVLIGQKYFYTVLYKNSNIKYTIYYSRYTCRSATICYQFRNVFKK